MRITLILKHPALYNNGRGVYYSWNELIAEIKDGEILP